jgi:hypothetical protein
MYKANIKYKRILKKLYINIFRSTTKNSNKNVAFFFKLSYPFYVLNKLIYNIYAKVKQFCVLYSII